LKASPSLFGVLLVLVTGTIFPSAASFPCDKIMGVEGRGRIPLVFFPEGFVETTRQEYDTAVAQGIVKLFAVSPYREYRDYFTVYKAWIPSKNGTIGSKPSDSTVFHAYYPGNAPAMTGIEPHLWTQVDTSFRCRDRRPDFLTNAISVIFVHQYAMSGAGVTYNSRLTVLLGHTGFDQVLPHELGHAIGALVDEYGQTGSTPGHSHFDSLGNPLYGPVPNITPSLSTEKIPWAAWIESGTPIPTPDSPVYDTVIGAFQGGDLNNTGRWRPARQCLMRGGDAFHSLPFCKVCREALVNQILRDSSQMSRMVAGNSFRHLRLDTVFPPPGTDLSSGNVVAHFPIATPAALHPRWRYNGIDLPLVSDTLDVAALSGSGDLQAILEGASPFIRNPTLVPHDTLRWTVRKPLALSSRFSLHDKIRRLGPGMFLVPWGQSIPHTARNASGRRIAMEAIAKTGQGTIVSGPRDFGEALLLEP